MKHHHVSQVTDVSWSPLTSTVFALTTVDGKVMMIIMMIVMMMMMMIIIMMIMIMMVRCTLMTSVSANTAPCVSRPL